MRGSKKGCDCDLGLPFNLQMYCICELNSIGSSKDGLYYRILKNTWRTSARVLCKIKIVVFSRAVWVGKTRKRL